MFHSGGFVVDDVRTAAETVRALVRRSGAAVFTIDDRLTPGITSTTSTAMRSPPHTG